jgi:hypothetical protein
LPPDPYPISTTWPVSPAQTRSRSDPVIRSQSERSTILGSTRSPYQPIRPGCQPTLPWWTAWIDDMLGPVAYDWAARRPAPTLLLPADPAIGLTRELVEHALAWAGDPGL